MKRKNATRNALFTSMLSLLLCVSMLVGTTFAWFTDEVKSGRNVIAAGNLDVELYHTDEDEEDIKVDGSTKLFNDITLWEPGAVLYDTLQVKNVGNLELKYHLDLSVLDETVVNGYRLSDVIQVGMINSKIEAGTTRDSIIGSVSSWTPLSAFSMKQNGVKLEVGGEDTFTLVLYWQPNSNEIDNRYNMNNENQGKSLQLEIGVNLYATQVEAESDSFGSDYDATASVTVEPGESIADAIKNVEDGGIVFLESGDHNLSGGPIVIEGKSVTIIGMGKVTINKNYGGTHIFTIKNGANVTIENVTMDGKGNTREGIYVRWNSVVTLKDTVIKNTGGLDIMIDEASDAAHGESTTSKVTLINTDVEDVAMCASPVTTVDAEQDTYVIFNYDGNSNVGAIDIQGINEKPENIKINGVSANNIGKTMYINVTNDAELAAALETIKNNSEYWNKQVIVNLAAGTYSDNYVINQYPQWTGIVGAGGSGNNYAAGVAGAPNTVISFVGEGAARAMSPSVVFTGEVVVNGFGNANTGFATSTGHITFNDILFDGSEIEADEDGNVIAVKLMAAADNVTFNNCVFQNTTHVTLGARAENQINSVAFNGCIFAKAGSLSGYPKNVSMTDCVVDGADDGFLNIQNQGTVTVTGMTARVGKYFLRTNGSKVEMTVKDSAITVYETEGSKDLVLFRGSDHKATFEDCQISEGYTVQDKGTNNSLEIVNYYKDEAGAVLYKDAVSGEIVLNSVSNVTAAEYTIPDNVTTLRSSLFSYNTNIKTVNIPASVTDFGGVVQEGGKGSSGSPFKNSAVETIVLAEGITELTASALEQAVNLKSITIPASVTTIGVEALAGTGITELIIPATVTSIGYGAFRDNKNLTTVTIEGNVYIPSYTFRSCTNLETVYINGLDVTFEKGMIFTCYDTGDGRGINIYVANDEIKERLMAADSAATTYGGYNVICKQTATENGYFTDEQGNAYAYDSEGLKAALNDDKDIILSQDITVSENDAESNGYGATGVNVLTGQTFDGNGNEFGVDKWDTWDSAINITSGTIKNLTITKGMRGIFINHNGTAGKVYLENVTIDGTVYTISCDQGTNSGLEATNSTFNGWTSYAATIGEVKFTDCSFGEGQGYAYCRPYAPTAFVECDFAEGYELDARAAVTFENCTIGGVALTAENLSTLVTNNTDNASIK